MFKDNWIICLVYVISAAMRSLWVDMWVIINYFELLLVLIIEIFEFDNDSAYDFIYIFESINLISLISFDINERDMVVDIDGLSNKLQLGGDGMKYWVT